MRSSGEDLDYPGGDLGASPVTREGTALIHRPDPDVELANPVPAASVDEFNGAYALLSLQGHRPPEVVLEESKGGTQQFGTRKWGFEQSGSDKWSLEQFSTLKEGQLQCNTAKQSKLEAGKKKEQMLNEKSDIAGVDIRHNDLMLNKQAKIDAPFDDVDCISDVECLVSDTELPPRRGNNPNMWEGFYGVNNVPGPQTHELERRYEEMVNEVLAVRREMQLMKDERDQLSTRLYTVMEKKKRKPKVVEEAERSQRIFFNRQSLDDGRMVALDEPCWVDQFPVQSLNETQADYRELVTRREHQRPLYQAMQMQSGPIHEQTSEKDQLKSSVLSDTERYSNDMGWMSMANQRRPVNSRNQQISQSQFAYREQPVSLLMPMNSSMFGQMPVTMTDPVQSPMISGSKVDTTWSKMGPVVTTAIQQVPTEEQENKCQRVSGTELNRSDNRNAMQPTSTEEWKEMVTQLQVVCSQLSKLGVSTTEAVLTKSDHNVSEKVMDERSTIVTPVVNEKETTRTTEPVSAGTTAVVTTAKPELKTIATVRDGATMKPVTEAEPVASVLKSPSRSDESGCLPAVKPKQWIKLERFDGQSPIEAFLAKYEICAAHNQWTDSERLSQLICSLSGNAAQVLWDFSSSGVTSWSALVERLRLRYGSSDQTALYRTQLRARRQKDGESLHALAQDVRRLMVLAYPGTANEMSETVAVDAFLDALNDFELAMRVRDRDPTTLDLACKIAVRLEANQSSRRREEHFDKRNGRVKTVREGEMITESLAARLQEQMAAMERRQQQFEQRLAAQANASAKETEQTFLKTPWQTSWRQSPGVNRRNREEDNRNWRGRRLNDRCYFCGQQGHYQRNCPQKQNSLEPNGDGTVPDETTNTRHIKGSTNAYLKVRVHGRNVLALVDSGSEMSLIPASLIDLKSLTESQRTLKAVNGSSVRVLGEVNVAFEISGVWFVVHCLVAEHLSEMILGLEWLAETKSHMEF